MRITTYYLGTRRICYTYHPDVVEEDDGALRFTSEMGAETVVVVLDDGGWQQLERIMGDRAFASECEDRFG